ncbi:hypothetical protein [Staphylococcus xylosus]|uniref:hypothetical protein n=1 Tax=Staphylococcus xylosus TaxID=1288 RepID=UPI003F57D7BE
MNQTIANVLSKIQNEIEQTNVHPNHLKSSSSYNGFEKLFSETVHNMELQETSIHENYGHHFPDIDIIINNKKYGVELKSRTDGSWINNGGSVFESVSDYNYEEIYLFFGTINKKKNEQRFSVRFAPYWTVTENIKVTHKPRYFINMNTSKSIFHSKSEYDVIRNMNESEKNLYVQKILKENTNKPQWYISEKENILPTLIKDLEKEKVQELISELLVLYPQDLLKTNGEKEKGKSDYTRVTIHLISTYFYYSPSTRDLFTAGGKFIYKNVSFPKIVEQFRKNKQTIIWTLENHSSDFKDLMYKNWDELGIPLEKNDVIKDYKKVLNYLGQENLKNTLKQANVENLTDIVF